MNTATQHIDNLMESTILATKTLGADFNTVQRAFLGAFLHHFPLQGVEANIPFAFRETMAREGGSVGVKDAAIRYRPNAPVSREALRKSAHALQLIGVQDGLKNWYFPVWQFAKNGGVLPGLREVLKVLHDGHPAYSTMTPVAFFLNPDPQLGATPLEALREGRIDAVKDAAKRTHE